MTHWTQEFIQGQVVYVVRADAGDYIGAANLVFQLLPQLMTGEEIRIRPAVAPPTSSPEFSMGGLE
jgi:hypothetical protein